MSAAELARRAGLSKATLSMIEAGEGNPTIETLAAIAVALSIPLTDLVEHTVSRSDLLVPATDVEITRELLNRIPAGAMVEIWRLRMPPGARFDGVPHTSGTTETLYLADGDLHVTTASDTHVLGPGDLLSFIGDQQHGYSTDSGADVLVLLATT
ncbi:transcriptional regulator [Corynebacterium yudongzhengii]|uniref:Helix-turn-helix domain-containing protein n=2 Tax=Corynebacterium yudongzhengii TaxID=2080740 RepID=A0A2U1T612_9CORY|nr:transcriptional regulator [Corynebacterium yudongzhengii]PWC01460.1 helix-turn-helix domain-containing protein [Corynebacterium yudongzhengii]